MVLPLRVGTNPAYINAVNTLKSRVGFAQHTNEAPRGLRRYILLEEPEKWKT
jgi:hypothetical protein